MPAAASPLYQQIACSIERRIEIGTLGPGDRVPSVRQSSIRHGVSVSTVVQAYLTLENRGFIQARPKSGFFVRPRVVEHFPLPRSSRPRQTATPVESSDLRSRMLEIASRSDVVPFGVAPPAAELLPVTRLNRVMASASRRACATALQYPHPAGCEPLRRQLARRSFEWGRDLGADDFIVTTGAMEAISLSLRAVTKPGDVVVLESPTYFGLLQAVENLGLRALEVPTHATTGMDLEHLQLAIRKNRIAAVLAVPSFNNPLGSCMPAENRQQLVDLLGQHNIPLIEDDIYGDLFFPPAKRPRTVKSFDRNGLVLLCGSVSKTLAPGWRVGWVVPGERYRDKIEQLKTSSTIATAVPPQLAVAEFFRDGGFDRHLRHMRHSFASQVQRIAEAVSESFPPNIRVSRPQGGFVLWIELPLRVDAMKLHTRALARGVSIAPGQVFSARPLQFANFVRLSCGMPWSPKIEQAISVLGRLVRQLAGSR
jgi:DNA-binding transcriptional MocR family regulator